MAAALRKSFADALVKAAKAEKSTAGVQITNKFADRVYSAFWESIQTGIQTTGKVSIPSFGTFNVIKRAARVAINPKNPQGPKIQVPEKQSVSFKASKQLKELAQTAKIAEKAVTKTPKAPKTKKASE